MKELKKPLTYNEQLDRLKAHGMVIENECTARDILSQTNYYRFIGYTLQWRKKPNESSYLPCTSFNRTYQIYLFDAALRDTFRKYIEIIEVYYRTQIAYIFSLVKCTQPPYDQHYCESNFYNKRGYNEVMSTFGHDKKYYSDSPIMKHHKEKYGGRLPLWALVEMLSFSNLSKLYSAMYLSEKNAIAEAAGTGRATLENHLHCLSVLRNKCAHAARLYNTRLNPPAKFNTAFLRKHPDVKNNTVFAYALILLKRLPKEKQKRAFVITLSSIIEKFIEDIDLSLIGFPESYLDLLENSIKERS